MDLNNRTIKIAGAQIEGVKRLAQDLSSEIISGKILSNRIGSAVILLKGDLGSGKTTFMKFFCEALKIKETITSPTFVIQKIYKIGVEINEKKSDQVNQVDYKKCVHMDLYRIDDEGELNSLNIKNILDDGSNIVCIEWPERAPNTFSQANLINKHNSFISINFTFINETTRDIEVNVFP